MDSFADKGTSVSLSVEERARSRRSPRHGLAGRSRRSTRPWGRSKALKVLLVLTMTAGLVTVSVGAAVVTTALGTPGHGIPVAGATTTSLFSDDFTEVSTTSSVVPVGFGAPSIACLTAGTSTSATPVPGCGLATPDTSGSGALRLTDASGSEVSGLAYEDPIPTTDGLEVTFDQSQYGGDGADGLTMFLAAGASVPSQTGGGGGDLGYIGMPGAWLGVGLDTWGNFLNSGENGTGCSAPAWENSSGNEVSVRGPGEASAGYCALSSSDELSPDPLNSFSLEGSSRADSLRAVRVIIDPSNDTYSVGIDPTGGSDFETVTSGSLPDYYYDPNSGDLTPGLPPSSPSASPPLLARPTTSTRSPTWWLRRTPGRYLISPRQRLTTTPTL